MCVVTQRWSLGGRLRVWHQQEVEHAQVADLQRMAGIEGAAEMRSCPGEDLVALPCALDFQISASMATAEIEGWSRPEVSLPVQRSVFWVAEKAICFSAGEVVSMAFNVRRRKLCCDSGGAVGNEGLSGLESWWAWFRAWTCQASIRAWASFGLGVSWVWLASSIWVLTVVSVQFVTFIVLLVVFVGISHHFLMADKELCSSICFSTCFFCFWFYSFLVVLNTGGLCSGKCTQRAMFALMRRRVPCVVKWSQPPSGRMRLRVTGTIF